MKKQLPAHGSFREPGTILQPAPFLPAEVYALAQDSIVIACTDIAIIDEQQHLWLAKRRVLPIQDYWIIGGRMKHGERPIESAIRCFHRETRISLEAKRLTFVGTQDHLWKDREQEPRHHGSHTLSLLYSVILTDEERVHAANHLEPSEYVANAGLTPFTREDLVTQKVYPALLDLYDRIF